MNFFATGGKVIKDSLVGFYVLHFFLNYNFSTAIKWPCIYFVFMHKSQRYNTMNGSLNPGLKTIVPFALSVTYSKYTVCRGGPHFNQFAVKCIGSCRNFGPLRSLGSILMAWASAYSIFCNFYYKYVELRPCTEKQFSQCYILVFYAESVFVKSLLVY